MSSVTVQKQLKLSRQLLSGYSRIAVLVDGNTRRLCYPRMQAQLPPHSLIEVSAGEDHKNLTTCEHIWTSMTTAGLDRHSLLIVLGGGVLGDMGGFCAATFKRGIDFLLIPTTLLAQTDASVGGKLGIDFHSFKNHIGVFQEPVGTLISPEFLETLPFNELRSGFAEIVKHCLISDRTMWQKIRKKGIKEQPLGQLVAHSVKFKQRVVKKDPREKGMRKILNFGHTAGHAAEAWFLSQGSPVLHGEAVAAGMIMESHIAHSKKMLRADELDQITTYLKSIYGKLPVPEYSALASWVAQDKKNKGNRVLMALPSGIGKAKWDVPVSQQELEAAIAYYQSLQI